MSAQCVNSIFTVHTVKFVLPKSTNAGQKKKKKQNATLETWTQDSSESKRSLNNVVLVDIFIFMRDDKVTDPITRGVLTHITMNLIFFFFFTCGEM